MPKICSSIYNLSERSSYAAPSANGVRLPTIGVCRSLIRHAPLNDMNYNAHTINIFLQILRLDSFNIVRDTLQIDKSTILSCMVA